MEDPKQITFVFSEDLESEKPAAKAQSKIVNLKAYLDVKKNNQLKEVEAEIIALSQAHFL